MVEVKRTSAVDLAVSGKHDKLIMLSSFAQ